MENANCGLYSFQIYPSSLEESNEINSLDSKIVTMQLNMWLNRNSQDGGCEADQSTEEGVPIWINSSDEHILDLTKFIINGDPYRSISIIKLITRPIIMSERNFLVKLLEYKDLEHVQEALYLQFNLFPLLIASSRRRVADGT